MRQEAVRWLGFGATVACVVAFTGSARADNAAIAEALFREGLELLNRARTHEACEKFSESYRLDPANGTLQNLAGCHEKEGRAASAWTEWSELAAKAGRAGQKDREQLARERAANLEKSVAHLELRFTQPDSIAAVTLDGVSIGRAAWMTPLPLDPGEHQLEFSALRKKTATQKITIATGATLRLDVPTLADAPPDVVAAPVTSDRSTTTLGYVVAGGGIVALGVGLFFGLRARSLNDDSKAEAAKANGTGDATLYGKAQSDHDGATSSQTIGIVAGAVGIVALGVGTYFILSTRKTQQSVAIAPALGPREAGLGLRGRW
jgi:hypothetical protein